MSEATHKENRFDDYSQDANVERHVRRFRWISQENRTFPRVLFWISSFLSFELNRRPNYFPIILECRRAFVDSSCSRPRSKARIKEEKRTLNVWFIVYDWKKNGVSIWARLNRAHARARWIDRGDIVLFCWLDKTKRGYKKSGKKLNKIQKSTQTFFKIFVVGCC